MISFIKGILNEVCENYIVVETDYFGYEIFVPTTVLNNLPSIGEEIKIYTFFQPREDAFNVYGFLEKEDKEIFKKLLTVNGIGAKGALAILSVLSVSDLKLAISTDDFASISRAQGVGKKTAQKVVLELKDKISFDLPNAEVHTIVSNDNTDEALAALISLGYSNYEAKKAISKCDSTSSTEEIIKHSLKQLSII